MKTHKSVDTICKNRLEKKKDWKTVISQLIFCYRSKGRRDFGRPKLRRKEIELVGSQE